ncbi:hypothetical protein WDJ51_02840 [Rathayibacter sp. YIM 133350]|uniref:hypothetical protein n=1 Tax=Rathayibacter sp. YIM 133350 TaxID=3131992 RepID=UPI00307CE744
MSTPDADGRGFPPSDPARSSADAREVNPDAAAGDARAQDADVPPQDGEAVLIDEGEVVETDREEAVVRRSPRYWRFMGLGAILGVVIALVLTFAFPANDAYNVGQVFGFLVLFLGVVGLALGGLVAVVLDRRYAKRARRMTVEHSSTRPLN